MTRARSRALRNSIWLTSENVAKMGVAAASSIIMARYLNPVGFGELNTAIAIVSIIAVFSGLGLQNVSVSFLVRNPELSEKIISNTIAMQLIAATFFYALCISITLFMSSHRVSTLTAIASLSLFARPWASSRFWSEANVSSRLAATCEVICACISATLRILLVYQEATVYHFAALFTGEAILVGVTNIWAYRKSSGNRRLLGLDIPLCLSLIKNSWPLIISASIVILYLRVDQLLLALLADARAVGIYSAALRISECWVFIPMALIASYYPAITKLQTDGETSYEPQLQALFTRVTICSWICALPISLFSRPLITTIFGAAYAAAGSVLAIHVLTGVFAGLSVISGRWMIDNGLRFAPLRRNLIGLAVNILLNILLIPYYGATGSALATLVSVITVAYLSDLLHPRTRGIFIMKTKALLIRL